MTIHHPEVDPPTASSPKLVPAGGGRQLLDGPLGAVLLAGTRETAGAAAFVIHPLAARALGSPVHTHTHEDEWTFVLEGTVHVQIGGDVVQARPGDLVLKPRHVPHAFWNPTELTARHGLILDRASVPRLIAEHGLLGTR